MTLNSSGLSNEQGFAIESQDSDSPIPAGNVDQTVTDCFTQYCELNSCSTGYDPNLKPFSPWYMNMYIYGDHLTQDTENSIQLTDVVCETLTTPPNTDIRGAGVRERQKFVLNRGASFGHGTFIHRTGCKSVSLSALS